jgi:hypothetical protein
LKKFVGEAIVVELIATGQSQFAAVGNLLALIAFGDDIDDAA